MKRYTCLQSQSPILFDNTFSTIQATGVTITVVTITVLCLGATGQITAGSTPFELLALKSVK